MHDYFNSLSKEGKVWELYLEYQDKLDPSICYNFIDPDLTMKQVIERLSIAIKERKKIPHSDKFFINNDF